MVSSDVVDAADVVEAIEGSDVLLIVRFFRVAAVIGKSAVSIILGDVFIALVESLVVDVVVVLDVPADEPNSNPDGALGILE